MYDHIDFQPPKGVADEAAKGLEYRRKATPSNKGGLTQEEASKEGIGSGVQRAVNLKNRANVSPEVIKKMVAFFSRHEKNKSIAPENKGTLWNDKGYVAWLLWGGDAGKAWANKVRAQMESVDKKKLATKIATKYASSFIVVPKAALALIQEHVLNIAEIGLQGGNPGIMMGKAVREISSALSKLNLPSKNVHGFIEALIGKVSIAERHLRYNDVDLDIRTEGKIVSLLNLALVGMSYDVNKGARKPLQGIYRLLERHNIFDGETFIRNAVDRTTLDFNLSAMEVGQMLGSFQRRVAKNLPPSVERYVKEHEEQGMDTAKAWAVAWSRYCQYKNPGSPSCKQDAYFEKKSFVDTLAKKRIWKQFVALPPKHYPVVFGVEATYDNINMAQIKFKRFLDNAKTLYLQLDQAIRDFVRTEKRWFTDLVKAERKF